MKVIQVELRDNPAWSPEKVALAKQGGIKPACHDGTPSADLVCPDCGFVHHMHLSQIEAMPPWTVIVAMVCKGCGEVEFELLRGPAIEALREIAYKP